MVAWTRWRHRQVATRITRVLADFHDGAATWDETLAALTASRFAPKPDVPLPADSGADMARWWEEVEGGTFPVDGTFDEVTMARLLGWITVAQETAVAEAQGKLAEATTS
jgi:hypothetical protein